MSIKMPHNIFPYLKDGGCNENTAKEICTVTKNDHGVTLCFKNYYIQINKDGWFLSDYEG